VTIEPTPAKGLKVPSAIMTGIEGEGGHRSKR